MIPRKIDNELLAWKDSEDRKVLLLRGARQVGKTYSVRQFARNFSSYLEVNFLESPEVSEFFRSGSLSPEPILEKLQAFYGISLVDGQGLLFLDEVQACPEALTALRFFHEKTPNLHVIAAGSLLEFALSEIPSFGVGRIESLFMYPVSLKEFFIALGQEQLIKIIERSSEKKPLDDVLHRKAFDLTKTYSIIGGLPAVVNIYQQQKDIPRCLAILADIVLGFEDDFAKYKTRISPEKLRAVLLSLAQQAGGKFVYSHVMPGASTSGLDSALDMLCRAGLAYKIYRSHSNGPPLAAEVDPKCFKVIPFDIGFCNALLKVRPSDILLDDQITFMNRGALAEILCGTELTAEDDCHQRPGLFYWARERKGANAEVDYVLSQSSTIIPLEVKAGTKGQMQSLYRFLLEKNRHLGIRTSLENFSSYTSPDGTATIRTVPLYAIGNYFFGKERTQTY